MKNYSELRKMFVENEHPAIHEMPADMLRDYLDFIKSQYNQAVKRDDKFGTAAAGAKQHKMIDLLYFVKRNRPDVKLTETELNIAAFQN